MIKWTECKALRAAMYNADITITQVHEKFFLTSSKLEIDCSLPANNFEDAKSAAMRQIAREAGSKQRDNQRIYDAVCKELEGTPEEVEV